MEISFSSQPIERWIEYGLTEHPINFNGERSKYKAIVREGKLISVVGKGYQLIPNEEAVKLADSAAEMVGLVPFHEFTGEWFQRMEKHVIYDQEFKRVHALYAINKPYTVNGESMHIGVGIHNSIDGTTAFGCGIFTFRHACKNMVLAGMRRYSQAFDERKTIEYLYKRHTSSLDPAKTNLKVVIVSIMDRASDIIQSYELMAARKASEELIKRIKASRLPKKALPDFLQVKEQKVEIRQLTQWELYNNITEKIWHNATSGIKTKTFQFNTLHKLMPLQVT